MDYFNILISVTLYDRYIYIHGKTLEISFINEFIWTIRKIFLVLKIKIKKTHGHTL